jgi:hypothetical protein
MKCVFDVERKVLVIRCESAGEKEFRMEVY